MTEDRRPIDHVIALVCRCSARRYLGSYPVSVRLTWPLTGRSEEMRLIEAALSDPVRRNCDLRCGRGGKSRIAREALESAASRGCVTHWAVGTSCARTLPWVLSRRGRGQKAPTPFSWSAG